MKNYFCIPRFRNNSKKLSPISLLDRFRDAVFRLIMLSALSKATHRSTDSSGDVNRRPYYRPDDDHHSEAVADCIEFIKKSAAEERSGQESNASGGSVDGHTEVVLPYSTM